MQGRDTGGRGIGFGKKAGGRGRNISKSGRLLFTAESGRRRDRRHTTWVGRLLSVLFACLLTWLLAVDCLLLYTSVFHLTGEQTDHILFLLAVSLVLTLSMYVPMGKWLYLIQTFVLLLPMLLMWDGILGGFRQAANEVIDFINRYYNTIIPALNVRGVSAWNNESHIFFLYLVTLLLWLISYGLVRRRKPILPLLPPVLFLALSLAVGKAPKPQALVLFFLLAAGTLGFTGGTVAEDAAEAGRGTAALRLRHMLMGLCLTGLVLTVVWRAAYPNAQHMVERRDDIEDFAEDSLNYMIETLSSMSGGFSWFGWSQEGRISNSTPRFQETEVLRVTTDQLPRNTVYLRGYVGDTYDHGKWTNEGEAPFAEEAAGWQDSLQKQSQSRIQSMPYISQQSVWSVESDAMVYDITYTDTSRPYAYLPYYTDAAGTTDLLTGEAASLRFVGDSMVEREDQDGIRVDGYRKNNIMDMQYGLLQQQDQQLMNRYRHYVERYTAVDEDLTDLKTLGSSLRGVYASQYASYVEDSFGNDNTVESGSSVAGTREQMRQIICISLVQQELWKRSYELELDSVPFGEDVVEYFLFQGEQGYCEHFASAGVLLLREMGIPARYVSGYVIWKDDFAAEDGGFTASVLDSRAHAWAEIYLEGVGWVPVEMTPGSYSGMAELRLEKDGDRLRILAVKESESGTSSATALFTLTGNGGYSGDDVPHTDMPGNVEEESTERTPEDNGAEADGKGTEADGEGTEAGDEDERQNGQDTASGQEGILLPLLVMGILLAAAAAVLTYRHKVWLPGHRAGGRSPGDSVQQLSGQIYRLLRRHGLLKGKIHSDEEFRRQMMEQQVIGREDVQRYLAIIEKAAYSRQEITAEEAEFCRQLCRRLKHMQETNRSPVRRRIRRRSQR